MFCFKVLVWALTQRPEEEKKKSSKRNQTNHSILSGLPEVSLSHDIFSTDGTTQCVAGVAGAVLQTPLSLIDSLTE